MAFDHGTLGEVLKNKKWIVDVSLVVIIIVMAIFVYLELSRTFQFMRRNQDPASPEILENYNGDDQRLSEPTDQRGVEISDTSPDFQLTDLEGEVVALSDYRGTAVLVNFWATWCPPCLAEMPLIQHFSDQHGDNLVVLAVNVGEDEGVVQRFVEEHQLSMVFLLDFEKTVTELFRVYAYPTTLFIDEEGVMQARHIGELNEQLLVRYLQQIGIDG